MEREDSRGLSAHIGRKVRNGTGRVNTLILHLQSAVHCISFNLGVFAVDSGDTSGNRRDLGGSVSDSFRGCWLRIHNGHYGKIRYGICREDMEVHLYFL